MTSVFTRLAAAVLFAAVMSSSGFAQRSWQTPAGTDASGTVAMCLNGSSKAVPCSAAVPLQVTGGGGGGGPATIADGADATQGAIADAAVAAGAAGTEAAKLRRLTTDLAAVLAKLSADPATQTTLAAVLAKIIAAPATEAKQDTGNTSVAAIAASAVLIPTATSTNAITPVPSTAAEGSHVLKASAGNLYGLSVTTGASAGYLMIFNATSAPADGAVTPLLCYGSIPATSPFAVDFRVPAAFSTGITVVFSTTGCFTKTVSATAFFAGSVK